MSAKRVLCVYATRQVDSNLLMGGTVFAGLQQAEDVHAEMLFCAPQAVCDVFATRYAHLFKSVNYIVLSTSWIDRWVKCSSVLMLLWSFILHFVLDLVWRPYSMCRLRRMLKGTNYDCVLSFVPPILSGRLGKDVVKSLKCDGVKCRLIQFWSDPLSLGRCNRIEDIPLRRLLHKIDERVVLSWADKIVFWYPLLCEAEAMLHPQFADKMSCSGVGYIPHAKDDYSPQNKQVTIGLFGAYQRRVRNIIPFLEAVKELGEYRFILRGDSDVQINSDEYPNLDFKEGRCPVSEIEELEANCDILVCLEGHCGMQASGKKFYYASYNKPILWIADGPNKEYFKRYLSTFERYQMCDNTKASIVAELRKTVDGLNAFTRVIPHQMQLDVIARKIIE